MANEMKYRRVVLKLSGEALAGEKGFGIDPNVVNSIARQIKCSNLYRHEDFKSLYPFWERDLNDTKGTELCIKSS